MLTSSRFGCILYELLTGRAPFTADTFCGDAGGHDEGRAGLHPSPRGCTHGGADPASTVTSQGSGPVGFNISATAACCSRMLWVRDARIGRRPSRSRTPAPSSSVSTSARSSAASSTVRGLDPRLIGHELQYLDNHNQSDVLVFFVHAVGRDTSSGANTYAPCRIAALRRRRSAFEPETDVRVQLSFRDHCIVLRDFIRTLVARSKPNLTILTGHSAGADVVMRLIAESGDDSIPIDGLLPLEPNLGLETCQVTRHVCDFEPVTRSQVLEMLNELSGVPESLDDWITPV